MPDFQIEKSVLAEGFNAIAGVDEVGRGSLFGPVVAAAVVFSRDWIEKAPSGWLSEVDDSKRLTPQKRKKLARLIVLQASSFGVGLVTNREVDKKNVYWASLDAMRKAVHTLPEEPNFLLVDGFCINDVHYPQIAVIHGDRKSISIASASIVAKVIRDEMMDEIDRIYKGYSLSKNKGYGTKAHYKALQELGPTSFHRMTFNLKGQEGDEF